MLGSSGSALDHKTRRCVRNVQIITIKLKYKFNGNIVAGIVTAVAVLLLIWWALAVTYPTAPGVYYGESHLQYCNRQAPFGDEGIFQPALQNSHYTLEMVQILARHGDRSAIHAIPGATDVAGWDCGAPESIRALWQKLENFEIQSMTSGAPVDPKNYMPNLARSHEVCKPGMLTKEGFIQHVNLGKHLRQAYSSMLSNYSTSSGSLYVRSTNYPRTIQSTAGLLIGLFPRSENLVIHVHEHDKDEVMFGVGLSSSSKGVESDPRQLEIPTEGSCHRSVESSKVQIEAAQRATAIVRAREDLQDIFGKDVLSKSVTEICDHINARVCHSLPLPCGSGGCVTNKLAVRIKEASDAFYCSRYDGHDGGSLSSKLAMYPFLEELRENFENFIGGKSPNVAVYVGHDTVIAPILAALGVHVECGWPSYASRITFELWREGDSDSRFVRVLYNGRAVTSYIHGCSKDSLPGNLCSASVFFAYLENLIAPFGSFDAACQAS